MNFTNFFYSAIFVHYFCCCRKEGRRGLFFFVLVVSKSSELYKFPTDNYCIPERSMDVGQIRAKGNQSTLKFGEIGPTQVKC